MLKDQLRVFSFVVLSLIFFSKVSAAQTFSLGSDNVSQRNHAQLQNSVFPQIKIAECDRQGTIYKSADMSIIIHGGDIVFQGQDSSLKPWTAQSSFNGPGCEIFQSDLSGNGKHDLLIITPGIGSRGEYDTRLTIILFNTAGKPIPWTATGRFSIINDEIKEIYRYSDGAAVIQYNYAVGHPAWGGVSYISSLYRVTNDEIIPVNGVYSGVTFPRISGSKANDTAFQKSISAMKLSTTNAGQISFSEAPIPYPHFVRYGSDTTKILKTQNNVSLAAEQGENIMVDADAIDAGRERIELSDGSKLDIPAILLVDSISGTRKIIFAPESTDMIQLKKGSYEIQQAGMECQDVDDCRPFILHAIEQHP